MLAASPARLRLAAFLPELLGLGALLALESWLLWQWRLIDTRPTRWDDSLFHVMTAYWRAFFLHPAGQTLATAWEFASFKSTPFWLVLMGFVQAIGGPSIDFCVWASSTLALAILMLATYGIGRTLFGRVPGLCAAALVTLYTGVVIQSHVYLLDLPLTAMVALAAFGLARLLRPRVQRRDVVLAALLLGLACFTKYQAPFFLWLPALFVLGWRWRAERARGASPAQALRHVIVLAAAFGVGVLLVVGPFLAVNFAEFLRTLAVFSSPPGFESYGGRLPYDGAALTLYSLGWSVRTWFAFAWGDQWLLLVLPVVGALVVLVRLRAAAGLLLGWYLGAFWPLWHMIDKEPRYDLPLYPAFALLSVAPLALLERPKAPAVLRRAVGSLVVVALAVYAPVSLAWHEFGLDDPLLLGSLSTLSQQGRFAHGLGDDRDAPLSTQQRLAWPAAENWQDAAIIPMLINARHVLGIGEMHVAFVPNLPSFNTGIYHYTAVVTGEPLTYDYDVWDITAPRSWTQLFSTDMVISKTGDPTLPFWNRPAYVEFANSIPDPSTPLGREVARQFYLLAHLPLPDHSEAQVYVRRSWLATWSALRDWPSAQVDTTSPDFAHPLTAGGDRPYATDRPIAVALDGVARRALFAHPPAGSGVTRISYPLSSVPERAELAFGIGMLPASWSAQGDGVEFAVKVVDGGRTDELFRRYIDPKHDPSVRRWLDVQLDLSRYAGRPIELVFETGPGPAGDNTTDWALWSEPILLPLDQSRLERLAP